jgi:hypothetical protein
MPAGDKYFINRKGNVMVVKKAENFTFYKTEEMISNSGRLESGVSLYGLSQKFSKASKATFLGDNIFIIELKKPLNTWAAYRVSHLTIICLIDMT